MKLCHSACSYILRFLLKISYFITNKSSFSRDLYKSPIYYNAKYTGWPKKWVSHQDIVTNKFINIDLRSKNSFTGGLSKFAIKWSLKISHHKSSLHYLLKSVDTAAQTKALICTKEICDRGRCACNKPIRPVNVPTEINRKTSCSIKISSSSSKR